LKKKSVSAFDCAGDVLKETGFLLMRDTEAFGDVADYNGVFGWLFGGQAVPFSLLHILAEDNKNKRVKALFIPPSPVKS
jgi:hypothetical protein